MVKLGFDVEVVPSVKVVSGLDNWDSLIIVSEFLYDWPEQVKSYQQLVEDAVKIDQDLQSGIGVFFPSGKIPYLIYSPTGSVNPDYDDVRRFEDAVTKAFARAVKAGKKNILLAVVPSKHFKSALLVSLLAAFEVAYVPIEVREHLPEKSKKIEKMGLLGFEKDAEEILGKSVKLELGRIVARDIGGSDPERMTAAKTEEYLSEVFRGRNVKVNVTSGYETFKEKFPLLAAVDRCANAVERHRGRLIYLEYEGEDVNATYLLVGKGITYDTGGADLKVNGHMIGMHRDKCGAAAIAGLFVVLSEFMPKGVKVAGWLAMVRNSVGADSYVADEIVTSAAGVRVRVGNTDAEGRMVMADPLFHAKEQALKEINPHIFTVATLTGHAVRAMGEGYSIVLDNGPAKKVNFGKQIQEIGGELAEPFEVSTLRREDYDFIAGRNEYEDVVQCNDAPSVNTNRGHQFPAAFMIRASGLDKHGGDSEKPLRYSHIDIAGSAGPFPGTPTGAPIVALARFMGIV